MSTIQSTAEVLAGTLRMSSLAPPGGRAALPPADLVGALAREVREELRRTGGNRRRALRTGLARLADLGAVTPAERDRLGRMFDVLLVSSRSRDAESLRRRLERIYDELVLGEASGLALTLGGLALSADRLVAEGRVARRVPTALDDPVGAITTGLGGAIAGGALGFVFGGPVGGLIGGIAGWVGAGFEQNC